jgi:hypothetical protein
MLLCSMFRVEDLRDPEGVALDPLGVENTPTDDFPSSHAGETRGRRHGRLWNWLREGAIALMPFAVIWLMWRTDRLGRQIEACTHLIQLELARHDDERERELLAEWKEQREQERKDNRMFLLTEH